MITYLDNLGKRSKLAFFEKISASKKNKVLLDFANLIDKEKKSIISENLKDIKKSENKNLRGNLIDRLILDYNKIRQIIKSIKSIINLNDPENQVLKKWTRPNGLIIKKVTVPIGVIGVIYESRPNVTSDVSSLCFKSGNCVILKGGSEAYNTNKMLVYLFRKSLKKNNLNQNYVQFIDSKNRNVVDYMLASMSQYIDIIIPRGGKNLVKKVQQKSKVPIIGHLEGICHTYIDKDADIDMAKKILINAKLRNTAICGATETILFHEKISKTFIKPILNSLIDRGCEIFADKKTKKIFKENLRTATKTSWSTEYLSSKVSVKIVKNSKEAIDHINRYGTMHTDAIVTQNNTSAKEFLKNIKSSIAMHNASTQFADGGEFGFGGEVGISTNKLPPRGPVGLNELVSYKYQVFGKGHIRK